MRGGKFLLIVGLCFLTSCARMRSSGNAPADAKLAEKDAVQASANRSKPVDWEKITEPGPKHKLLSPLAGKWKTDVKFWTDPTQPPDVSEGRSELSWILGGRFLRENYSGSTKGQLFNGMGIMGYDNVKEKFTSLWLDSMATGIMSSQGEVDSTGKNFTFFGSYEDPATGATKETRLNLQIVDNARRVLEMYETDTASGKEWKTMEITYTKQGRKK